MSDETPPRFRGREFTPLTAEERARLVSASVPWSPLRAFDATVRALTAERDRYRAALEFYADGENSYEFGVPGRDAGDEWEPDTDETGYCGSRARAALRGDA